MRESPVAPEKVSYGPPFLLSVGFRAFSSGIGDARTIARLLERGVIVELEGGVEGFIPTSKLTTDNIRNPAEAFKPGDVVPAAVIEVEAATRKLTLSVVDFFKNKEDAEWKAYLSSHKPNLATLGDVMPKLESE